MTEQTARYRQDPPRARAGAGAGSPDILLKPLRRAGMRYTRFVAWMKLVLPIIATAVIALVVIWPHLETEPESFRLGLSNISVHGKSGQQVVNARFTGNDSENRPFTVTADSALQPVGGGDSFELEFPKMDISMANGSWVALSANSGTFNKAAEILVLTGGVNLFHDSGYEFQTRAAEFDLGSGTARGSQPVAGQGPFGTINAEGFKVLDHGRRIIFTGKAKLIVYPGIKNTSR